MNINDIKQFLSFQAKALDCLEFLIKYDREQASKNNQPAEKTIVLKAFIDTQRRSLDVANLLLKKHESSLIKDEETKTKAEKEKRAKEQAIKSKIMVSSVNIVVSSYVESVALINRVGKG